MILHSKVVLTVAVLAAFSNLSIAQDFHRSTFEIEEVIITAQKREESLQDVSVSVYAVMGDDIRAQGIEKLETLAPTVPTLHISEGFGTDQLFLRGLGSGINFGFEQAVGLQVDGYFYGRSRFGRVQFLDIERVEVLKGPQGAIIGKNTTAGALNITTAKPTEELEGWLSATINFEETDGEVYEGAISGPLVETLTARLAFRLEDRDGYVSNRSTGQKDQVTDDIAGRLSLLWRPQADFSALFQYTVGELERSGRNMEVSACSAAYIAFLGGGAQDCSLDYRRSATATRNGVGNFERQETDYYATGITLTWELDRFMVSSLTGYADYDYLDLGTNDRSPIEAINSDLGEDYRQFSQELRLVSIAGGEFDYIAGIFYQDTDQSTLFDLHLAQPGGNTRRITTDQETETFAVFGQLNWHLDESWDLIVEGRYTLEEKEASQHQLPLVLYANTPFSGPGSGGPAGLFNVHQVSGDRRESGFSPGVTLEWHPDNDTLYYASIKRGFKGGGFDHMLDAEQMSAGSNFEFDEENVTAYELGGKLALINGTAQLNFALFRSEFDDLQVSGLVPGGVSFLVTNAATAISQGVEVDFKWRLSESLTLTAAVAYLDAEFDSFDNAACYDGQAVTQGCLPNGTQDLGGEEMQFAPEWSSSFSLTHVLPLGGQLTLTSYLMGYYVDDQALALDLDPETFQDDYTKVDARITLAGEDKRWELSLIGRNLTDKTTSNFANDLVTFSGSYWRLVEAPRTLAVKATLRF